MQKIKRYLTLIFKLSTVKEDNNIIHCLLFVEQSKSHKVNDKILQFLS